MFCCLWLQKKQSVDRNEQSSQTNTGREFATKGGGNKQPDPLVTTYNPHTLFISGIANRNWTFLQSKERLAKLFKERPLIAYRRPKSPRDMLVSSKLRSKTAKDKANTEHGCGPCHKPKCSCCLLIEKTTTFTGTNQADRTFDILHTENCQSAFVIYIIECRICKVQYVGKSETAFNLRLNNSRNHRDP